MTFGDTVVIFLEFFDCGKKLFGIKRNTVCKLTEMAHAMRNILFAFFDRKLTVLDQKRQLCTVQLRNFFFKRHTSD